MEEFAVFLLLSPKKKDKLSMFSYFHGEKKSTVCVCFFSEYTLGLLITFNQSSVDGFLAIFFTEKQKFYPEIEITAGK